MAASTVIYLILFGVIALGAALFFYFYKPQGSIKLRIILASLRFISLYALLVLLLNPSFKQASYTTLKPKLALTFDNTSSIEQLGVSDSLREVFEKFQDSKALQKRFDIDYYLLGDGIKSLDSLSFTGNTTNISKALSSLYSVYNKDNFVPVIITDGNANLGSNYTYTAKEHLQIPHYFIAAGDTTNYEDLSVDRVNVNKYAYLKNRFPVEISVSYSGEEEIETTVSIQKNGSTLFKENVNLSKQEPARRINTYLEASNIGTSTYEVIISRLTDEKNTANNSKRFGIEVIDQRSQILIVYSTMHPDLGTFKKAFESNQLRTVTLKNITELQNTDLGEYNLVVLFEPQRSFRGLYTSLNELNINRFTVVGPNADRRFLNEIQKSVKFNYTSQTEEAQSIYNRSFSSFQLDDIDFSGYPPLTVPFGEIEFSGAADVLLTQKITGIETTNPLLAVVEIEDRREVFLFGTQIFKWRSQAYLDNRSFEVFDGFMEKLAQFSASDTRRTRLQAEFDRFYYGGSGIVIRAQYFDKNYIFDAGANLVFRLNNQETSEKYESPMVPSATSFNVSLPVLEPGNYNFSISENAYNQQISGTFTVIEYNMENQVIQADFSKMRIVAEDTDGMAVTINKTELLIARLLEDNRYIPIQRETIENIPLIQFWWLLIIIAIAASSEWFVRKYNGLI